MRVLLIENQISQYNVIKSFILNGRYTVYPLSLTEYVDLINIVKIILNKFYPKDIIANAKENFINLLNAYRPNVIIIDFKLSGSVKGDTGVELATFVRQKYGNVKIIFLSRMQYSEENVRILLRDFDFPNWDWIEKGYAGKAINKEDYFNAYVLKLIEDYVDFKDTKNEIKMTIENIIQEVGSNLTSDNFIDNFGKWNTLPEIKIHKVGKSNFLISENNISMSYMSLSYGGDVDISNLIDDITKYCVQRHQNDFIFIKYTENTYTQLSDNENYNFETEKSQYNLFISGANHEDDRSSIYIYVIK